MRQLHYTLVVILASLLVSSSVAQSNCPNITAELLNELGDGTTPIDVQDFKITCSPPDRTVGRFATVVTNHSRIGSSSREHAFIKLQCTDGGWVVTSFMTGKSDLYGSVEDRITHCAECIDEATFNSREYPINPPDRLEYNRDTHCLKLPKCFKDGNLTGYFSARQCCLEKGNLYMYGGDSFTCIVHGFTQTEYSVMEGNAVDIVYKRNVKGETAFPLLTIQGSITSSSGGNGTTSDDYESVSVTLVRQDETKTFTVTANNDTVALEEGDTIILTHVSTIPNYVFRVENEGEFISHTAKVTIIDKDSMHIEVNTSYTVSEDDDQDQVLNITWENVVNQAPVVLEITSERLEDGSVSEAEIATAGQDFVADTLEVIIPQNTAGGYNISLKDIILEDSTVENRFQLFNLGITSLTSGVTFVTSNSNEIETKVAIESADTAEVKLNTSVTQFSENTEGPFNVCVFVRSGENSDCPVEFQTNYTISFTRISKSTNDSDDNDNINHTEDQICRNVTIEPCSTTACIDLKDVFDITDDDEFHLQSFNISLLPDLSMGKVEVFTDVIEFKIIEDDLLQIEIEQKEYYVFDSENSIEICLKVDNGGSSECPTDAVLYYNVHTNGGNATAREDYKPLGSPYNIDGGLMQFHKCAPRSCFNINITDDSDLVEGLEYFNFTLELSKDSRKYAELVNTSGAVFLLPKPTVSLMMDEFSGNEGDTVRVCGSLDYDEYYNITLSVNVVPSLWDDEIADFEDFDSEIQTLWFNSSSESCVDISLREDDMVEDDSTLLRESFRVTLESNNDYTVLFGEPKSARVFIIDNDVARVVLDLETTNLTLTEGDNDGTQMCASVVEVDPPRECPIQFDARIAFLTAERNPTSAEPREDYGVISRMIPIEKCQTTACIPLQTIDDNIVELDELFEVYVTTSPGLVRRVSVDNTRYIVTIEDDDIATIRPESLNIEAYESVGEVTVMFVVEEALNDDCPIDFRLNIDITIPNLRREMLVVEACEKIEHSFILNIADEKVEESETFDIILTDLDGRRNIVLKNGTIVVMDDDDGAVGITVGTAEEGQSTEVCAMITRPAVDIAPCPVGFSFNVTFSYDYGNGNNNGGKKFMFDECDPRKCVDILIADDNSVENQKLLLYGIAIEGNTDKLSLESVEVEERIIDNDEAVVNFERSEYVVSEGERVEIRVTVSPKDGNAYECPVGYNFNVSVNTTSAGATQGEDFSHVPATLLIPACSTGGTLNINIFDDNIDEEEESFILSLGLVKTTEQPLAGIEIELATTQVIITDALRVGFTEAEYIVNDSDGVATVCVGFKTDCLNNVSLSLEMTTTDGNAGSDAYTSVTEMLTLSNCENTCVDININNNQTLRKNPEEFFYVNLRLLGNPEKVSLFPAKSKIIIRDTTMVSVVLYKEESVDEGSNLTVCLVVDSELECPIAFPFEYFFNTSEPDKTDCAGFDFKPFTKYIFVFGDCQKRKCLDIPIKTDDILEGDEIISLLLEQHTNDRRIHPQEIMKNVTITDDYPDVAVDINPEMNPVSEEQGFVRICATATGCCPVQPRFTIPIQITGGTADSGEDFQLESESFVFESCQNESCINVVIVYSPALDKTEEFKMSFLPPQDTQLVDYIHLQKQSLTITIEDPLENIAVSLESEEDLIVRETEIQPLTVCAKLTNPVDFPFNIGFVLENAAGDEVNKTQVIVERNMTRVCGAIYFTTAVEAGELKEFSLYLSKGDEDLYSKILLSDVRRKIFICDEIECVVDCYVSTDCSGSPISASGSATARQCCTGHDDTQSYKPMDGTCQPCIVHGFSQMIYNVEEGDQAAITFQTNVKGETMFDDLNLLLLGSITTKSVSAEECDYVDIGKVKIPGEGPTSFSVVTLNDDIALEKSDQVALCFNAVHNNTFTEELEAAGEFLRDKAYLDITDNDDLEINFDEMSYEVTEGESKSVVFRHRRTEEDFTLIVTPVVWSSEISRMGGRMGQHSNICPATKDDDFVGSMVTAQTTSSTTKTATDVIRAKEDDVNENPQVYFLLAEVELMYDLSGNTKVCFKRYEKDINCTENRTALVRIIDNDPIGIGFAMIDQSVDESAGIHAIEIRSNITSERDHPIKVDIIMTKSTATVSNTTTQNSDVSIGNLTNGEIMGLELDPGERVVTINAQVFSDQKPEGKECFILRISPNDAYRHDFMCDKSEDAENYYCYHTFCIEDGGEINPCRAEFTAASYSFKENDTAMICVQLVCPESTGNYINVDVYSNDSSLDNKLRANGTLPSIECIYEYEDEEILYNDYLKQIRGCNMLKDMQIMQDIEECFVQVLINDMRVEKTEYTGLALYLKESSAFTTVSKEPVTVEITDNDYATVGVEKMYYTVNEGDSVTLCVDVKSPIISCPVNFGFNIMVSTSQISAGSNVDFEPISETLYFEPCQTSSCINVSTIMDGCVVELMKNFSVNLQYLGKENIVLDPPRANIGIIDNDVAYVRILPLSSDDVVPEDAGEATVNLAVTNELGEFTCSYEFPFTVAALTAAGTATINKDYKHISINVPFTRALTEPVKVQIFDDDTVDSELEESFFVYLDNTPGVTTQIKPVTEPVKLVIRDNDHATFGLERASCNVLEGTTTLTVCVVLKDMKENCPVEFAFDLKLNATDGTATRMDHDAMATDITFEECQRRECTNITIYDDMSLEKEETFFITLTKPSTLDNRIRIEGSQKTVIIRDDDFITITFDDPGVLLESYPAEVCLLVEGKSNSPCPSLEPLYVNIETKPGTAVSPSDYIHERTRLEIPACVDRVCHNITTVDDNTVEKLEYFFVNLELDSSSQDLADNINITQSQKRYEIIDKDMAEVFLTVTPRSTVNENVRILGVCVNVRPTMGRGCPVDFSFDVRINKMDISADGNDYDNSPKNITIPKCGDRRCTTVTIHDDCHLEHDEKFALSLELLQSNLGDRFVVGPSIEITIEDNDKVVVQFEHTQYTIVENETTAEVCVVVRDRSCPSAVPFTLSIDTVSDSAEDTGLSADYVPITDTLIFSPNVNKRCIQITIINDVQTEQLEEAFNVTLQRMNSTPDGVNILHSVAVVVIQDDDVAVVGLEMTTETVDEEDGVVEICVVVKSPTIQCPIVYPVDFIVEITDIDTTKGEDYTDPGHTELKPFRYAACEPKDCFTIKILNDDKIEDTYEKFNVTLKFTRGGGNKVSLDQDTITVTITDENDEAMVSFTQSIYVVEEVPNGVVRVCANVTPTVDFAFAVNFSTAEISKHNAADDQDFTAKKETLEFAVYQKVVCTTVEILDDCVLEELEEFKVKLFITDTDSTGDKKEDKVKVDAGDSTVKIIDNQVIYVNLEEPMAVLENNGSVEVCAIIEDQDGKPCSREAPFNITFSTEFDSADENDFVAVHNRQLMFPGSERKVCTEVIILDDVMLEQTESFRVNITFTKPYSHVQFTKQPGDPMPRVLKEMIIIRNDDVAIVGLERTTYTVRENDLHLDVCVVVYAPGIQCPVAFPFDLRFTDTPGTALRGSDYSLTDTTLRFGACAKRQCLTIDIINNDLIEEDETFTITLQHPSRGGTNDIMLNPTEATITIEDYDIAIVTFERPEYSVQETSSSLRVCARIVSPRSSSCPVNHAFNLTLYVTDGTANNGSDYLVERESVIEFPRCYRSRCAVPRISFINDPNDVEVEEVETFSLSLFSHSPLVSPDPDTATVNIHDDSERAYIRLEQTVFTVTEGVNQTVAVCAEIYNPSPERSNCPVTFPFEINLSVDGEIFPITFAPCFRRACVNVPIVNDAQLEPTKTVSFRLERPTGHDNRIVVSSSSGRLTILDDPTDEAVIKLAHTVYIVREELIRRLEICANVTSPVMNTPIDFAFNVEINTVDGTAVSTGQRDFRSVIRGRIDFSIGERKDCYSITIYNDDTQENTETFTVTLNRTSGLDPRIKLEDIVADVSILDADNVTIEFQRTTYTVNENVGMAELCVQFTSSHSSCPVAYDFSLVLVNMEGSASRHNDYVDADATGTLVVEACHRVKCFSVGIVDSNQLEDQESFEISLFSNGLTDNIRIGSRKIATVTIRDDDTVEMGLSQTSYRVVEGQVLRDRMCVEVYGENGDCIIPFPLVVYITTTDGRADSPEDYTSLSRAEARFPPCTAERCADIVTINDEIVEGDENFYVSVTRDSNWDSRIRLIRSRAQITIEDDDSARVTIKEQTYTVDEDQRAVNICAVVSSPFPISDNCELDFSFSVRVVPIPGTAGSSDYGSQITLSFPQCVKEVCRLLGIDNDNVMEGQEQFTVSLQSLGSDTRIRISAMPSTITINDDDDVTIQMQYSVVTVNENSNTVTVCTTLSGTSDIYNAVRLSTISDTAVTGSPSDFTGTSPIVTFGPRSSRQCISINITNDDIVEEREYFNVTLGRTGGLDSRVQFGQRTVTTVFINDNDRATVRLDPQVLEDEEGESVEICAVVESSTNKILGCVVEFDFNITLQIRGTADSTNDYSGLTSIVTVPKCRNRFCVSVELTEDQKVEVDETILIRITRTSASSIRYDSNEATITIRDNDHATLRLVREYQIVRENVGTAEVCAEVTGSPTATIAFPFNVMFKFIPASATYPDDFKPTELTAQYDTTENKACVRLVVVDSPNVEQPESLTVEISVKEEHSAIDISPTLRYGIIEIRDDDTAVVGLSRTGYTMSSTAEEVQVCVRVWRPTIDYPFNIFFNFTDETAAVFEVDTTQMLSEGEGIEQEGETAYKLKFDAGQRDFCFQVRRRDVTSGHSGMFGIAISRTPDHGISIVLDAALTTGFIKIR